MYSSAVASKLQILSSNIFISRIVSFSLVAKMNILTSEQNAFEVSVKMNEAFKEDLREIHPYDVKILKDAPNYCANN